MITVRSKDKVSPETVLPIFVLKLDLGMIYHCVYISDFLFYLKNRGTQRITLTHTLITFLKKSFPISPSAAGLANHHCGPTLVGCMFLYM